ncbi:rRNA maturation RNase YbeY [Beggiatoa leptomitoformis]|uniref:Endoribonuclease YbeY n=1 Tax=Beggiatoa leptomitoformis TaxID=288004 RepID=A0A2N9YDQ9_9GAMM|nr:rRNA maturation RNase YbeY [Beggiatoa leptomitoformis]ALG69088.1 rRNA maturation RNase YbeY [Beggiatoa leptomitoformis]AUI68499.1 rRNA maturation RNase YbeY [Beggiatoa leptomitoformis]
MNADVDLQYACAVSDLPTRSQFVSWVNAVLHHPDIQTRLKISRKNALTIRIVDEAEGKTLNETWRQKAYATNVLSFPFETPKGLKIPLLGDIIICAPVVVHEANEQQKPLLAHWAHLVIHGTLHLIGYDHVEDAQAERMESLEIQVLQQLGYSDPYNTIDKP